MGHYLVLPKDMKHCLVVLIENAGPEIDTYSCNLIVYGCSYILSAIKTYSGMLPQRDRHGGICMNIPLSSPPRLGEAVPL